MGIQSTQHVSRKWAIERITRIQQLAASKDYNGIAKESHEYRTSPKEFVDTFPGIEDVSKWTNDMLGDLLDEPFYRRSEFDNYLVNDE